MNIAETTIWQQVIAAPQPAIRPPRWPLWIEFDP